MQKISRRSFLKSTVALSTLPLLAQAKEKKSPTLKFIHVTDSHMDLYVDGSEEAIKRLVSFINAQYKDLDFVLFGGDNFNNNSDEDTDAQTFKKIISALHCPSYLVRGNKESSPADKETGIDLESFKDIFFKEPALRLFGRDWVFEKNGYMIMGIDSCIEHQNNGLFSPESLVFAQKCLQSGKPTVMLNHHPYTNYWGGTEKKDLHKYVLNNSKEVQEKLFTHPNLILTLSGHKHIDSVTQIQKTKVIVTRGFVKPLDKNQYPMRYVQIHGDKIDEKLIYTS